MFGFWILSYGMCGQDMYCNKLAQIILNDFVFYFFTDFDRDIVGIVSVKSCGHKFHAHCLLQKITDNCSSLNCPVCGKQRIQTGTQPISGSMTCITTDNPVDGHKQYGRIVISYE